MDIFTDFDVSYGGEYYDGIPAGDGSIDVFGGSTVAERLAPNSNGFTDGNLTFHSANAEGGADTFINGKLVTHTQPNIFGGEDFYNGTEIEHMAIPNEHGGFDIYGENLQYEGTTFPNAYGSEDYLSSQGNTEEILSYPDPLRHVQNLQLEPFDVRSV